MIGALTLVLIALVPLVGSVAYHRIIDLGANIGWVFSATHAILLPQGIVEVRREKGSASE